MKKLGTVLGIILLIGSVLNAQEMLEKVKITSDPAEVEGCERYSYSGKKPYTINAKKAAGKSEAEIATLLKDKAFFYECDTVLIVEENPTPKVSYTFDIYNCFDIRITSNPNVVEGCKFLGNVEFSSLLSEDFSKMRLSTIHGYLKDDVWKLGGDTLFFVGAEGNSGSGEAYDCGMGLASRE